MNRRCVGCGTILQCENNKKTGYVIPEKINDALYCERCFKIKNYNQMLIVPLDGVNDIIIDEVNKKAKYVFFLIDLLNLNEETIDTFKSIKCNKCLVISKLDVIPKSIKQNKIINWLYEEYNIDEEIIFLSSNKKLNISRIPNMMEYNNVNEAYILGYTNAGKSTLINSLSIKYNLNNNKIVTSLIPNTTLDFIKIKLNDDITIIDSPGFTMNNTLYSDSEYDLIKRINPKSFLKPVTYQVKDIASVLIEDKIRINSNINNSFTLYMSNDIDTKKVYDNNDILLDKELVELDVNDDSDLVIRGLGFINIKKACKLKINISNKDLIEVRKSMFRDDINE